MIDSQVINHLLDADLVIADLSLLNANAFYEIGLRHMERKPIIHVFRAGEIIPFDVKPYRAIPFAFEHPKQRFEARDQLKQAVEAVLAPGYQVENPVTRARGYAAISQHATPDMQFVLMEIESLKTRVQIAETTAAVAQDAAMRAAGSPPMNLSAVPASGISTTGAYTPSSFRSAFSTDPKLASALAGMASNSISSVVASALTTDPQPVPPKPRK
jgi:hypothetical protein